ncbi:DUF3572 domain-containing protein [Litoreibacter janthinus]|uniref:DUF3572 domain-containing protein n=1 Tax=Litoreibacter janthinus TaxID=670154 RepID=A0A1I6HST6_9RHOB|nr:DUF3572 domain-containing protein [Litoreibacter janthinus]SFR57458.1 Protein of unknown function [Litoreibacter janthinus]
MTPQKAEQLALSALGWIAASDDLMGVFLGATGSSIDTIRAQAADPEFLGSVLDFLLMDDSWVSGFCDFANLDYRQPMIARQVLPGGEVPNWT